MQYGYISNRDPLTLSNSGLSTGEMSIPDRSTELAGRRPEDRRPEKRSTEDRRTEERHNVGK